MKSKVEDEKCDWKIKVGQKLSLFIVSLTFKICSVSERN